MNEWEKSWRVIQKGHMGDGEQQMISKFAIWCRKQVREKLCKLTLHTVSKHIPNSRGSSVSLGDNADCILCCTSYKGRFQSKASHKYSIKLTKDLDNKISKGSYVYREKYE